MKIRMKVQMSGTRNGKRWPKAGETADIPTGEATHLVASGIAEHIPDEPVTEPVTETATGPEAEATTPPPAEAANPAPATKRASPKPRKTAASKAGTKE